MIVFLLAIAAAHAQGLVYSTYLGGGGSDIPRAMAVDRNGNVYVTGETLSSDFPVTAGVLQSKHAGVAHTMSMIGMQPNTDVFVTKLSADGSHVIWSTYLGGSRRDVGTAIAVDSEGNVYVAGTTMSADFPTTKGAWQTTADFTGAEQAHGFIAKINSSGTALIYSTLLAGSASEEINGLALDRRNNAIVAGSTSSADFPITPGAWQTRATVSSSPFFSVHNAFVTKLHVSGSALVYSTFLTGNSGAVANAVAVDSEGSALVAGTTSSPDFPITPGAYEDTYAGPAQAFAVKVHRSGTALLWSTFLGRSKTAATAIATDAAGSSYISGMGPGAAFVMKLDRDGGYGYSTLLGGRHSARPNAILASADGNVYVAGQTYSADFPVTARAFGQSYAEAPCYQVMTTPFNSSTVAFNCGDGFLTQLDATGSTELFSSYFAGNDADSITALGLDGAGKLYMAGWSRSANLPVSAGALRMTHAGAVCSFAASPTASSAAECEDGFVVKVDLDAPAPALQLSNAASRKPGAIMAGELAQVRGIDTIDGLLLRSLGGNGAGEFLVTVPNSVSGKQRVTLNGPAGSVEADVAEADPGIFTIDRSGHGQAAMVNQDSSVNGPAHPATPGSIVQLYVTGAGVTPSVWVGGKSAEVLFAGTSLPLGLQQINFRVPAVAPGPQSLFISSGRVITSQAGVFMTVGR